MPLDAPVITITCSFRGFSFCPMVSLRQKDCARGLDAPRAQFIAGRREVTWRGSRGHAAAEASHGRARCRAVGTPVRVAQRAAPHFGMFVEPLALLFGRVVPAVVVTGKHDHYRPFESTSRGHCSLL